MTLHHSEPWPDYGLSDHDPEFSMGDHMFRDLALSRDILREFHERGIGGVRGEKLSVMVLQRSYWPFTARQKGDILLPLEVCLLSSNKWTVLVLIPLLSCVDANRP